MRLLLGWMTLACIVAALSIANPTLADKCQTCKSFVAAFTRAMDKTKSDGFGGGNTDWEERSLGAYAKSETRLEEILESSCESQKDYACHTQLEESEDTIYEWWKSRDVSEDHQAKSVLQSLVCEKSLKACCPSGHYGPSCKPCPGGMSSPCSMHGTCDGDGTYSGTGKCKCEPGYKGKSCNTCKKRHFMKKLPKSGASGALKDQQFECVKCDPACASCSGQGPLMCTECAKGYELLEGSGCVDIDECALGQHQCGSDYFCNNTMGGAECRPCHSSCDRSAGCTGSTSTDCRKCASGFRREEPSNAQSPCVDIDECGERIRECDKGMYCINAQGWSECRKCHAACDETGCTSGGLSGCRSCRPGYRLRSTGLGCEDINECTEEKSPCTDPQMTCINSVGSFQCKCPNNTTLDNGQCTSKKATESSEQNGKDEL